jgi:hypothetical protein
MTTERKQPTHQEQGKEQPAQDDGGLDLNRIILEQVTQALRPVIEQMHKQVARALEEQVDKALTPVRQELHQHIEQALQPMRDEAQKQIDAALQEVRQELQRQVDRSLDEVRDELQQQIGPAVQSMLAGQGSPRSEQSQTSETQEGKANAS